jgi:glyoxylase-like metal-dependent hydrolase (beta-lactamase superfamily II)
MDVQELGPGLWRWTARHPDWRAGAGWPPEVGCVYYEAADAVTLIDPQVPADEAERFWRALDRDVERLRRPVAVVLTAPWHTRSSQLVVERYGGRLWESGLQEATALPAGLELYAVPPVEEGQIALFLPEHRALVTAEILADLGSGLAVCPSPSLDDPAVLAAFLRELSELPVELILPAHGPPVLTGAQRAMAAAIAQAPNAV